ncbi:Craniofacial development protein 2 [Eumeta japonica]|uniref:Craniofacial development protein 2 n=1 Tax=Eumeta variegata TaxID=151549 RepID=A0A4C1YBR4_EUMVA|nr:Craniofacial development protein 2 [Eumeta japonica]
MEHNWFEREVRRMGESITCYPDFLLYQIGETQGQYGVGFIIKQHSKQYVKEFIGISERIAILNMKLPGYKKLWSIVQIYSPTEQSNSVTINNFYQNLNEAIQKHTHENLIVMGDFNGQIGARRSGENAILGQFSYSNKTRSKNGEIITNFALESKLTILNTMFKKNRKSMGTWISPDGKTKNEIDFIMTNRNSYFTNFTVIKRFNFNTNHRLIRTELQINEPKKTRPRQDLRNIKLNEQQLEQITTALRTELRDFEENTKQLETQDKYNYMENAIKTQIKLIADTKMMQREYYQQPL